MAQFGYTVLLWPVNYIACTFSAYLKQCKWIGHVEEELNPFHWQSHSHGVTLPLSKKTSLVSWVKYALAKSHSTKLPTGYSHRKLTYCYFFFHFQNFENVSNTSSKAICVTHFWGYQPSWSELPEKQQKSILKWKKRNSQESAVC